MPNILHRRKYKGLVVSSVKTGKPIRKGVWVWPGAIVVALKRALIGCAVKEYGLHLQPPGSR
jgi:hypothetical protein